MNPIECLSSNDKELITQYLQHFCTLGEELANPCELSQYLRYWNSAKKDLFKAFGNQFILSKSVSFKVSKDELYQYVKYSLFKSNEYDALLYEWGTAFERINWVGADWQYKLARFLPRWEDFSNNRYTGPDIEIPAEQSPNQKRIIFRTGTKMIKIVQKVAKLFDMNEEIVENFRNKHSLTLNTKTLTGKLCLSIHPLDYMTMSDNASGWSSCMSWKSGGDYRLGTVEMMNSPYVIVAYLKSTNSKLEFKNSLSWNNKKWRQLIVITPETIIGNKQYPYDNDLLEKIVLEWVNEIFNYKYDKKIDFVNHTIHTISDKKIAMDVNTDYMYNDLYDIRTAYINSELMKKLNKYEYNISGPAVCSCCGRRIEPCQITSSFLLCSNCGGGFYCEDCGRFFSDPPAYAEDTGELYCIDCYNGWDEDNDEDWEF